MSEGDIWSDGVVGGEKEKAQLANLQKTAEQNELDQKLSREQRKGFANFFITYLSLYSTAVLAVLFLCGFKGIGFQLPENILLALVGGIPVSIMSFLFIITRWLFRGS